MADVHGESFLLNSWLLGQRIWGQKPAQDGGLSKLGDFPERVGRPEKKDAGLSACVFRGLME
jgi:hypothetical protein